MPESAATALEQESLRLGILGRVQLDGQPLQCGKAALGQQDARRQRGAGLDTDEVETAGVLGIIQREHGLGIVEVFVVECLDRGPVARIERREPFASESLGGRRRTRRGNRDVGREAQDRDHNEQTLEHWRFPPAVRLGTIHLAS